MPKDVTKVARNFSHAKLLYIKGLHNIISLPDFVAEFFLSGNPLSCDCEMDWLPSVNAASAAASGGGDSRNPRVADLADLECSVDLGKAEDGRFKVS